MQYGIFFKKIFQKNRYGSEVGSTKKGGTRKEPMVGKSKEEGEKKKLGVKEQYILQSFFHGDLMSF
jgi:hypothetical protein